MLLRSEISIIICLQIERILFQIKYDPVSFTGKRFFKITKSTILFVSICVIGMQGNVQFLYQFCSTNQIQL